jgi:hypothetical protein
VDPNDPNMPHLVHHSPLHDAAGDPHAPAKPAANDANPLLAPAIPPLHTTTVEVFPVDDKTPKLQRTPPLPPLAKEWIDRTPFDWTQVRTRQEDGQYVLAAGSLVLGRFSNDHDARMAESVVKHYRFTEWDHVGRPQPFCAYFLCGGEAPRGQCLGIRTEPIELDKLSVTQVENRWVILSGEKPLIWFGTVPEEARVMLDVIQREQFDRLCHIGDDRGLTFFARSR